MNLSRTSQWTVFEKNSSLLTHHTQSTESFLATKSQISIEFKTCFFVCSGHISFCSPCHPIPMICLDWEKDAIFSYSQCSKSVTRQWLHLCHCYITRPARMSHAWSVKWDLVTAIDSSQYLLFDETDGRYARILTFCRNRGWDILLWRPKYNVERQNRVGPIRVHTKPKK